MLKFSELSWSLCTGFCGSMLSASSVKEIFQLKSKAAKLPPLLNLNNIFDSRLRSIVENLFPKSTRGVQPKDAPLTIFVKVIQFIARVSFLCDIN